MLMTRVCRREMLATERGGKGLFHRLAARRPRPPLHRTSRPPDYPAGRPTPTSKHPDLDGTTTLQPSAFGALVKVTTIDLLADVEHLRAFTDVLACELGCSDLVILAAIAAALERMQRREADDVSEVLRLGRVRQNAAREIDRLLGKR